jgi:hypothetical protein
MPSIVLVRKSFGARTLVTNLLADTFKFDPNHLENKEKLDWITAKTLGEGSFVDNENENDDENITTTKTKTKTTKTTKTTTTTTKVRLRTHYCTCLAA